MSNLIDGRAIAEKVYVDLRREIAELKSQGTTPGLAVILVGDNAASRAYVRSKDKMCRDLGLHSVKLELPESTTQDELLRHVEELNRDSAIHGILVQSPPPRQIDEAAIVRALDPRKDVDGFHPENIARLALGDPTGLVPCTPLGCQRLLIESKITIAGAHVVVLRPEHDCRETAGASSHAKRNRRYRHGGPFAQSQSGQKSPAPQISLVAAIGRAEFLKADHVREGVVVIDVGINRVNDAQSERGYRLVGDVAFDEVVRKAAAITPVPGGVGPMTIAMLMSNTVKACRAINSK